MPMKTASPTVSNTHSAASGMRPNVGRTERSQPKTSPMISAPPLAVRLRGRPPTVTVSSADEAAEQDAQADEDDVGLARGPLDVAERLPGALDVLRRADQPEHVAPVDHRLGGERDLLAAADHLQQDDAAPVLLGQLPSVCSAASLFVTTDVQRGHGEVEQLPVLDLLAERAAVPRNTCRRALTATTSPGWSTVSGLRLHQPVAAPDPLHEDPVGREDLSMSATVRAGEGGPATRKARTSHSR